MSTVICKFSREFKNFIRQGRLIRNLHTAQKKLTEDDVEEIKIPVPWGHIAGKWWGDKNLPPVLALHGWQDNANTFDNLIPHLNLPSVLAIDLPGHGFSSHLPPGKIYDAGDYIMVIHRIKKHFEWEKMPLLCHSLGSALGFVYTSIFPNEVKWLINIECARSLLTVYQTDLPGSISKGIDSFFKIEQQKINRSPPTYKLSKMVHMSIEGSFGSVSTPESALTILRRGIYLKEKLNDSPKSGKASLETDLLDFMTYEMNNAQLLPLKEQEEVNKAYKVLINLFKEVREEAKNFHLDDSEDKYYAFTRDPFIKVQVFQSCTEALLLEAAKNIKCPVFSIRAKNGFLHGSTKKLYEKTLEILKTHCEYLDHHEVDGTHHVHLNNPEFLVSHINNFLQKYNSAEVKM